ncbi:MAG: signal peptidase I [Clostridiales bacterium]|nr:signal peptidase I [Clostridiales bacterium]MBF0978775.1 signal peptidase I [Clostridiales bacterium]MBF0985688.1 signal peptidase I [Clostridiales bacterium]
MKVLKIIGQFILCLILIFFILLNIFSMNNKSLFGFRIYRVISGSMQPALQIGDVIIVKKSNNYSERDIITYSNGLTTITHRIIAINNDEVITKGDANEVDDKPINKEQIVGKFFFRISNFSLFSIILSKNVIYLIMIFLLVLIFLLVIGDRIIKNLRYQSNNVKKLKKNKEKNKNLVNKRELNKKDELDILAERMHKKSLKIHKKFFDNDK